MKDGQARKKISNALSRLCTKQTFFGVIALHLSPTEWKDLNTMATDGYRLFYDPEWVKGMTNQECETVVSHEALHAVLDHPNRKLKNKRFSENVYEEAMEHAVNNILKESGYKEPNMGWLLDEKYKWWSVEDICKDLEKKNQNKNPGQTCVHVSDLKNMSEEQRQVTSKDMSIRISKAHAAAKAAGNMPAGVQRLIEEALYPSVSWTSYIRQLLEAVISDDYNWMKPDEEMLYYDVYLPSLHDEAIIRPIVITVDTSASMSQKELNQAFAEMSFIMTDLKPREIHIICADAAVESHDVLGYDDLPLSKKISPKGGGGTNFIPAFDYVEEEGIDPLCMIYLSDMQCHSFPKKEPGYPVLWGSTVPIEGMKSPPFGELIHVDV